MEDIPCQVTGIHQNPKLGAFGMFGFMLRFGLCAANKWHGVCGRHPVPSDRHSPDPKLGAFGMFGFMCGRA